MKSQTVRVVLLSAFVFAGPMLSFAAGQHLVRVPTKEEMQDRSDMTRALQPGKGTGMTRNEGVRVNASRAQTPAESQVSKDKPNTGNLNLSDHALRK
jgi:hypothetical protein